MLNILTRLASFQRHVCGVYQAPVYLIRDSGVAVERAVCSASISLFV